MQNVKLMVGDCVEEMLSLEEKTVNMCVTSPPYFGLRDYGVEGQIGLEQRAPHYIDELVKVFDGVKRVLRETACCSSIWATAMPGLRMGSFRRRASRMAISEGCQYLAHRTETRHCSSSTGSRTRS